MIHEAEGSISITSGIRICQLQPSVLVAYRRQPEWTRCCTVSGRRTEESDQLCQLRISKGRKELSSTQTGISGTEVGCMR